MSGSWRTRIAGSLAAMLVVAGLAAAPAAPAIISTNHTGTTSDGGSWLADVPSPWNGAVLLYSHGFGPLQAADAPDPATKQALLDRGYALVGSSYDPAGSWWALGSALRDQFEALDAIRALLPSKPREVIAFGTSMGGLISALESERGHGRIDGALTTCGIVAGAIDLGNYQLDGEYAMAKLLAPAVPIKLVRFANADEGLATGKQFDAIAQQAQSTAEGRARLALAMAFLNVPTWAPGQAMPAPTSPKSSSSSTSSSAARSPRWTSSSRAGRRSSRPRVATPRGRWASTSRVSSPGHRMRLRYVLFTAKRDWTSARTSEP